MRVGDDLWDGRLLLNLKCDLSWVPLIWMPFVMPWFVGAAFGKLICKS